MGYNNRNDIPEKYKWDLSDIFATEQQWEESYKAYVDNMEDSLKYKGKLADKDTLLECLKSRDKLDVDTTKLYCYAFMSYNEDAQDSAKQERFSRLYSSLVKESTISSYIMSELAGISNEQLDDMIADARFSDYDVMLKQVKAGKEHTLSEKEEKLLANTGSFSGQFQEIFNRLDSGDIKFDDINVDGETVKLGHGTYSMLLQNKDQAVRKLAFETYYKGYIDKTNTIAGIYEGSVKADWFAAQARNFDSCMSAAMFSEHVDKAVYDNLIESIHGAFEPLHNYIALRKRVLGVDTLNMYDLYTPIFEDADISCEYEEACELVVKALAPLGEDYLEVVRRAFNERWIDVHETPTKRSGAYSMGVTEVHPYMLLNYQKTTHDIFTIAHEMGHSMHTYYSQLAQPVAKEGYKIFVAEVASTCNEILLLKYLIANTTDVVTKKYLLQYYLDMLRTTMYRQSMFAEFEAITHSMVEKGQPLTAQEMCKQYKALNEMYYGPHVVHNDEISYEWSRIPHFYRAFYVYKYATGIISAVCIADDILTRGEDAVKQYKQFLSLGCSMPPVEELKVAGVDLTTKKPFDVVAKSFADTLAELEQLCK